MLRNSDGTFKGGIKMPNAYSFGNGVLHPLWKGDNVGYHAIHAWVKRSFGSPNRCDNIECQYPRKNKNYKIIEKPKRYEWANISKKYKRDRFDWIQLCPSCHRKMDCGSLVLPGFVIDGATYILKSD